MLNKILLVVLFASLSATSAQRGVIDDFKIIDSTLCVSYHIDELLDEKSIEALQRGVQSEVVHKIQLWQQKSFINPLEKELNHHIKVFYDNWEKKFKLETPDGYRLTPHIETVKRQCAFVEYFPLVPLSELERNKNYYVSVQVTFQLISAESYNALSDVFAGEKKKSDAKEKKQGGFTSVLVNLLGLGDREFSLKSGSFIITETGQFEYAQ
ncbi:DUF4390 domain-containing protein [candidate division KSB1 bacterium]|nr:DUF4390 domain-containing protein [candidate division KSB1 bacterium]RQW10715.1 MAG: DUF4390 domain-containing protein [candidate division KSB1 bacterium]